MSNPQEVDLRNWTLTVEVDGTISATYKFEDSFVLGTQKNVKVEEDGIFIDPRFA